MNHVCEMASICMHMKHKSAHISNEITRIAERRVAAVKKKIFKHAEAYYTWRLQKNFVDLKGLLVKSFLLTLTAIMILVYSSSPSRCVETCVFFTTLKCPPATEKPFDAHKPWQPTPPKLTCNWWTRAGGMETYLSIRVQWQWCKGLQ